MTVLAAALRGDASYDAVLRGAAKLAGGQPFAVLSVYPSPSSGFEQVPTTTPDQQTASERAALQAQIEADVAALGVDATVSVPVARLYNLGDDIAQHARQLGATVVVIGTHGRKGLARIVLGSVAEGVVRSAPCDVHVVRPPAAG